MKKVYLSDFKSSAPKYVWPQQDLNQYLSKVISNHNENSYSQPEWQKLIERFGAGKNKISSRRSDFVNIEDENYFEKSSLKKSMFFHETASQHVFKLFDAVTDCPDHVLHVTCTGYVSPSAVQNLVQKRKWNSQVTHLYHMGCYASMPAVRTAQAFLQTDQSVDIVHNEICSLHLNPLDSSAEQLVIQSLFADGHIKYRASSVLQNHKPQFEVIAVNEFIVPETSHLMTWAVGDHTMDMTLSREVPQAILLNLNHVMATWQKKYPDLKISDTLFAIHPGGPKIIELVAEKLNLQPEQYQHSKKVLFECGNMSSATLPHIWSEILDTETKNKYVLSFAFGPGLTFFSSLMRTI